MWEIIRAGGGFMWPIILCSIAAVAIILERLWTLQSSRVIPRDLSQKVWNWIEADQLSEKLIVALEQNSPLGKLLAIGLVNRNKPRALMVERLEDGGRHVIHELHGFLLHADDETLDFTAQKAIGDQRGNGDRQTRRSGDERFADAARQRPRITEAVRRDGIEGMNDAGNRPEQAEQRRHRGNGSEGV